MDVIRPVAWNDDGESIRVIDQRELPGREVYRDLCSVSDVCDAIRTLTVRGAPLIGIVGAMGLALSIDGDGASVDVGARFRDSAALIRSTRPTAVNLGWAIDRMSAVASRTLRDGGDIAGLRASLRREADAILAEDRAMCRCIGEHGAELIPDDARILTHCNTGALATGGIGTALAAIYVAVERGKRVHVFADETRPLLQGSRLTAWELERAGIPVTVLVDGAAASLLRAGAVDLCIVGADRIATNGDVANKVGTLPLAIAARHFERPFYVAAPTSTFDPATASGDAIVIEQRAAAEVRSGFGVQTAPLDFAV